jgi:uncharacterized protein (TIGR02147 family)
MENFRDILKHEYLKRASKNPQYSLRAFAQTLDVNHAILSMVLSGKRKVTKAMVIKFSNSLGLSPIEVSEFIEAGTQSYFLLQNDVFSVISEWYYDAILEMSLIPRFNLGPEIISKELNISTIQATYALETLERLELLKINENGKYVISHKQTTNILDTETTTSALRSYQRSVLEKSLEALERVDRKKRDHSSITMAINSKDLLAAKELIKKFRRDLNAFMQRDESSYDEIYQLQISFFPLTNGVTNYEN